MIQIEDLTPEELEQLSSQVALAKQNLQLTLPDMTAGGVGRPTRANTDALLKHYMITVRHNEMTKEMNAVFILCVIGLMHRPGMELIACQITTIQSS